MELSGILVWAALLVSLIAFIIFLVKGFKTWGIGMTICWVILFIEGWTFLFLTASLNKKRLAVQKEHDGLEKQVETLEVTKNSLLYGADNDPKPGLTHYVPLSSELGRVLLERGRAWRGARVTQVNNQSATFELPSQVANLPPPNPEAGAAAPAAPAGKEGLAVNDIVYLFGENESLIPAGYIGEFKVTTVAGNLVTVVPTTPLTSRQQAASKRLTWAVYDLLPIDSHLAFASPGSQPNDSEMFGSMNEEKISELLGIPLHLAKSEPSQVDIVQSNRSKILKSYLADGTKAPEGTPLGSIFYEVEFVKDYDLKVDSNITNNAETGSFFNPEGQAVDSRIKRAEGETYSFKANQKAAVKIYGPSAKKLEMEGIVKLGQGFYVRPLNEYNLGLRTTRRLTLAAIDDEVVVAREIAVTDKSQAIADADLRKAEDTQQKLEADQKQYKIEEEIINAEFERLSKELETRRAEANKLYRELLQLHSQLKNPQFAAPTS